MGTVITLPWGTGDVVVPVSSVDFVFRLQSISEYCITFLHVQSFLIVYSKVLAYPSRVYVFLSVSGYGCTSFAYDLGRLSVK